MGQLIHRARILALAECVVISTVTLLGAAAGHHATEDTKYWLQIRSI